MNERKLHLLFSVVADSTFFAEPLFDSSLLDSGDVDSEPLSLELSLLGDTLDNDKINLKFQGKGCKCTLTVLCS